MSNLSIFYIPGYQRQMKYRHSDNSYSAWGEVSWTNATGSSWLTAFVVKSMAQSMPYITIDESDVQKSIDWLISTQTTSGELEGCFPRVGKVFSSYMKGGLADGENPAGLTAFILIALLEANLDIGVSTADFVILEFLSIYSTHILGT